MSSSKPKKAPIAERLERYGVAKDISDVVGKGVEHLPVSGTTKAALKYKSAEVATVAAETGAAIAKGAVVAGKGALDAVKEGAKRFDEARREDATTPYAPPSAADVVDAPIPIEGAPVDVLARLRELVAMRDAGHLSDEEFAALKAKLISGQS